MAKSKTVKTLIADNAATPAAPAAPMSSYAKRFGEACVTADAGVSEAMGIVTRREGDALRTLAAALEGSGSINTPRWEAEFREPVRQAMVASNKYVSKDSVKTNLSRHYRCALAISNGIAYTEGESERAYVSRVKDQLAALTDSEGKAIYEPQNSGGKAKAKPAAAPKLDDADAQCVAWLVTNAMPQLRALYAQLCPATALDKAA